MSKSLTKMQIETAEKLLRDALSAKKREIAEAAFKKDTTKHEAALKAFNRKAAILRQDAVAIKKAIEKNSKLEVNLDEYSSLTSKLPKSLEEAEERNDGFITVKAKGAGYRSPMGAYEPKMEREEKEVNDFILGLKLGTALLADLQKLLDKVAKAK